MTISKSLRADIISECERNKFFVNGRFVHQSMDKLHDIFKAALSKRSITRIVKNHFIPKELRKPTKTRKPRNKGGALGRPPKVSPWVRDCIDEIGQTMANDYICAAPADILEKLTPMTTVQMCRSTFYRYYKYTLQPATYGVRFALVDGTEWNDEHRVEYAPPNDPIGTETLNPIYSDYSIKIKLWQGVQLPHKCLPMMFNFMDNLEDNEDYALMKGSELFRYMPCFKRLSGSTPVTAHQEAVGEQEELVEESQQQDYDSDTILSEDDGSCCCSCSSVAYSQ